MQTLRHTLRHELAIGLKQRHDTGGNSVDVLVANELPHGAAYRKQVRIQLPNALHGGTLQEEVLLVAQSTHIAAQAQTVRTRYTGASVAQHHNRQRVAAQPKANDSAHP